MERRASPLAGSDPRGKTSPEVVAGAPQATPHPRHRSVLRVGLILLPFLGLGIFLLAPWIFPRPPVGNFSATPANPIDVGERLVGPVLYTLDARAADAWTFFHFARGSVVELPHQFGRDWDLGFQRHKIIVNGGATNPKGRGGILNLGDVPFEDVAEAPANGYVEDTIATITPEGITTENLAIKAWYDYSMLTHLLHPKPNTYVIRTADGRYAKLRLVSYYCDGGQASGCFTFEYVYQGSGSRSFVAGSGQ